MIMIMIMTWSLQGMCLFLVVVYSAMLIQFVLQFVLFFWFASEQQFAVFFVVAALWGIADGIIGPQIVSKSCHDVLLFSKSSCKSFIGQQVSRQFPVDLPEIQNNDESLCVVRKREHPLSSPYISGPNSRISKVYLYLPATITI